MNTASRLLRFTRQWPFGKAGLPGRRLAGPQHGLAPVLAQDHFAFEHVNELVLLLVPVALRRGGSRLQGADVDTELGQAGCSTEPLARAPLHRPVERRRIIRRLVERQLVDIDFWHFCSWSRGAAYLTPGTDTIPEGANSPLVEQVA